LSFQPQLQQPTPRQSQLVQAQAVRVLPVRLLQLRPRLSALNHRERFRGLKTSRI
jgi:hypothetical protein